MKKILFLILILISLRSFSQLESINVNLTLKSGDWAFIAGSVEATDSTSRVLYRRMRDTIRLANPPNYNTNVRINAIPALAVLNFYKLVRNQPATLYDQIGTNISTQIKAIVSIELQAAITAFDAEAVEVYKWIRTKGKSIVMDN